MEFKFEMNLKVFDPAALYKAACARALEEGHGEVPEELLGTQAEPDIGNCLVMMLDPGTLEGCSIHQSTAWK